MKLCLPGWAELLFPIWKWSGSAHTAIWPLVCVFIDFQKGPDRNKPTDYKRRIHPKPDEAPREGSGLTSTSRPQTSGGGGDLISFQLCEQVLKDWQLKERHLENVGQECLLMNTSARGATVKVGHRFHGYHKFNKALFTENVPFSKTLYCNSRVEWLSHLGVIPLLVAPTHSVFCIHIFLFHLRELSSTLNSFELSSVLFYTPSESMRVDDGAAGSPWSKHHTSDVCFSCWSHVHTY